MLDESRPPGLTGPRVSVVMPVWNGARFLDEAVESIVDQDFHDFEFVIVDDASTDETPSLLAAWAQRDPRIRVIRNPSNRGVAVSLNRGLEEARGRYIARQDADDISLPGRLRLEVEALDADPGAVMVSMNFQFIDENGTVLRTEKRDDPPEVVAFVLNLTNAVGGHSQVMFRTDVVRRLGGYDTRFPAEDYELWTRLAREGRIVILPQVGLRYRLHAAQKTAGPPSAEQRAMSEQLVRREVTRHLGRETTEEEIRAVMGVWRGRPLGFDAVIGLRILREMVSIFAANHGGDPMLMHKVRAIAARRLSTTAALLARAGHGGTAARLFVEALRWDTRPAIIIPFRLARLSFLARVRGLLGSLRRPRQRQSLRRASRG